jgi:hypothetical protein
MFKKAVIYSNQPNKLPKRVAEKLNQGPRIASRGFNNYGWSK